YGCKVIHGIVDSMWLQDNRGRSREEFERVTKKIAEKITKETRIPMSWDGMFNIIAFLPSQAEPDVPTLNHYWGIKKDGSIKVRGIEIRRRDIPMIIKKAQKEFINIFQNVDSTKEFMERIPEAKKLFLNYVEKINSGNVTKEELTIRQHISRRPSQYKVNSYQSVAAKQAERSGLVMTPGKNVRYIILNADADADFPQNKVVLSALYNKKRHKYDKEKYIELLKRAFENIFPFNFPDLEDLIEKHRSNSIQKKINCFL
ncbi:MAG: hypothetical protein EU550_02460, partial [Promethearchaeota archaeon]